jgi:hypothetical protein
MPRRLIAALAVAWAPVIVATVRALDRGWLPMGDNAYFAIRARDVLTEHHPLVGAWSSGSAAVGVDVNNLGPLQLDLLALPVRALGFGPGTAIGVALVNLAAVSAVVVLVDRRLGVVGAWLGAAMATATCWTMGSELLFEPRQHHALVLPMLAYLPRGGPGRGSGGGGRPPTGALAGAGARGGWGRAARLGPTARRGAGARPRQPQRPA